MSKINNWFLQPNMQTDGLITEIKSDDYGIDNNYVNLLERKIDPDFENGFGQSINNYRYPSNSTVRIIFQGEAYGRGSGDGSADEHGCIVNNYSDLNMQQYKNGLGCTPGYYTI